MSNLPTFYCDILKTQVAYGNDAYYYLEDDKTMTCVPYHKQDGILWDERVTYDPNVDSLTVECNTAFSILSA